MPPSPRYRARFTEQARLDIAEIRTFTVRHLGSTQWAVYKGRINTALRKLCQTPHIGKDAAALIPGLKSFHLGRPKGAHYIYYRVEGRSLIIVRVIHDARDQGKILAS